MRRRTRWTLPAVVASGALFGACHKNGGSEQFPQFQLVATYPVTGQFQTFPAVCSGAESTLVSFDTDGDAGFEYRFLFDAGGNQLWGCGDEPCTGPIDGEIPVPRRVMIEGITVPPNEYGNRRHDVACRGLADTTTGMGKILAPPLAFPGLEDAVHAEIPMLRVGAFNGMFTTEGPIAFGMASTLLVAPADREQVLGHAYVATGGIVIAAGGSDPTNGLRAFLDVYEFHPWEISYRRTATLTTGHTFADAQSFVGADDDPDVIFIGGIGTNGRAVLHSDVYRRGLTATEPVPQALPRYFPGVAKVETGEGPAIAVLNGCWGPGGPHSEVQVDYEVFYPLGTPAGCPNAGQRGFCTKTNSIAVEGRCQGAIQTLSDGRVWFATGARPDNLLSDYSFVFDEEAGTFTQIANVQSPVRLTASVPLAEDRVALFGGFVSAPGQPDVTTDRWVVLDGESNPVAAGNLLAKRGFHTATMLLDGRVLVAAGFDGAQFTNTAEIVERGTEELGGQSEYLAPAGRSTCVAGVDCERLSEAKLAQSATLIQGSATWLEGAVLLSGGSLSPNGTSEIFVPAYWCEGSKPVNRLDGERVPGVELCDRLRDPQPLTDPRKPKRF